jgi:GNAT superfamily N-acetyltransferase
VSPTLINACPGDAHQVTTVIVAAFRNLDVTCWLVPAAADRQRVLYAHFRILVDHAFDHGHILMTANRAAAAVWFTRDSPPPPIADYDHRLQQACGPYTERFRALDAAFAKQHPDTPHHHLALLAVQPDHQHLGHGTALLRRFHLPAARAGLPCYLEASSYRARTLYARHGYHDLGNPIDLPEGGPRLWGMWRPGPPAATGPG